jgi:hypothetical protein
MGSAKIGSTKISSTEIGYRKIGPSEISSTEIGPCEGSLSEVGFPEISPFKIGIMEIGEAEDRLTEVRLFESSFWKSSFTEIGIVEVSSIKISVPKACFPEDRGSAYPELTLNTCARYCGLDAVRQQFHMSCIPEPASFSPDPLTLACVRTSPQRRSGMIVALVAVEGPQQQLLAES